VPRIEGSVSESISARLFRARLDVIGSLDGRLSSSRMGDQEAEAGLRQDITALLRNEVAAMNADNFLVRPHRKLAETYAKPEAWEVLQPSDRDDLAASLAGLPAELDPEKLEAKQFDLVVLNLQLCVLDAKPGFDRLKDRVIELAAALVERKSVPAIAAELELLLEIQAEPWWQDVTVQELDRVRRKLRGLMHLIDKKGRSVLYTNFVDEMGEAQEIVFEKFVSKDAFARFREKARVFLKAHEGHIAIHKLRSNLALTPTDLTEMERMLLESGTGSPEEVEKAKQDSEGLGLFVRSLLGMDRAAAQQALAGFMAGKTLTGSQIEFIQTLIENLTKSGVVEPSRLYEPPYTRFSGKGVEGIFREAEVVQLIKILDDVRVRATA
jgi:type I restriction enzyme R subunit